MKVFYIINIFFLLLQNSDSREKSNVYPTHHSLNDKCSVKELAINKKKYDGNLELLKINQTIDGKFLLKSQNTDIFTLPNVLILTSAPLDGGINNATVEYIGQKKQKIIWKLQTQLSKLDEQTPNFNLTVTKFDENHVDTHIKIVCHPEKYYLKGNTTFSSPRGPFFKEFTSQNRSHLEHVGLNIRANYLSSIPALRNNESRIFTNDLKKFKELIYSMFFGLQNDYKKRDEFLKYLSTMVIYEDLPEIKQELDNVLNILTPTSLPNIFPSASMCLKVLIESNFKVIRNKNKPKDIEFRKSICDPIIEYASINKDKNDTKSIAFEINKIQDSDFFIKSFIQYNVIKNFEEKLRIRHPKDVYKKNLEVLLFTKELINHLKDDAKTNLSSSVEKIDELISIYKTRL